MSLILSPNFILQNASEGAQDLSRPIIGWDNQVTVAGVSADHELANFPAENVANPSTNLVWTSSSTATQYLTFLLNEEAESNYLGIARHNLGSTGIVVSVEIKTAADAAWEEMVEGFVVPDDSPILLRFPDVSVVGMRLKLVPLASAPEIAIVHIGRLLVMPIGLAVGHTPLIDGRVTRTAAGTAEAGDYLGSIILSQRLTSTATFQNLDEDWYRANMRPFIKAGRGATFFFSSFPESHPREAGYAWLTEDPQPEFLAALRVNVSLVMGGIVT